MAGAEHWRMVWPYMHMQCMCLLNLFVQSLLTLVEIACLATRLAPRGEIVGA